MMPSGQITAQFAHPIQLSSIISKKLYPFLFTFFDKAIHWFGQPVAQTPHPLQRSVSITKVPLNAIVSIFNVINYFEFRLKYTILKMGCEDIFF